MSGISDALAAIRDVLLLQSEVKRLDSSLVKIADDVRTLANDVAGLNQRLSRMEGFLEGASMASGRRDSMPKIEG